ncbi:Alpha/beta hydrolase [Burkholderiales bacterium]|nr:Alpha/beta hydrolase [Burkholderiales bacterium]
MGIDPVPALMAPSTRACPRRDARARLRTLAAMACVALAGGVDADSATPHEASADQARPAAAADSLAMGQLEFKACEIGAQRTNGVPTQAAFCATLPVPENWEQPAGRHIGLRVALVRSLAAEADRDLVVFLDGGPGGAATEDYPALAAALSPLRKHHHILLVDQRGTGGSNPLACGDELALEVDKPSRAGVSGADRTRQLARVRRCLAALAPKAAPQFYTTSAAVQDLEAVRQALGDLPLDLVGVSYGTRVAQQYAARYPDAVRSIVLDSAVPNRLVLLSEHARNLEDVVQRRLARCQADAACVGRFGDPYASLRAVQQRLRQHPQSIELRDPRSFALVRRTLAADDLAALVRFYMYSASTSALLPFVITEARDGRYAPLLGQAQLVVGEVSETLGGGVAASVLCSEDADLLHERPQDRATLLGDEPVRAALLACEVWPHRPRPRDFHQPFHTSAPVLVLAGELDPVTPPRYGNEIVDALPHARLLIAPGQGHAVIGVGCMPKLVGNFVQQLDPARLDDQCLQSLGDTAVFLDANGAAP